MNRIVSAEPLPDCRLKVTFNDGVSGIFPVDPERRGGVFLKLLDARIFKGTANDSPSPWGEGRDEGGRDVRADVLVSPTCCVVTLRRQKQGKGGRRL